jgi:hypothetical protein
VLVAISLVATTIAIVAVRRQPTESVMPAPAPSVLVAPAMNRTSGVIEAYEQLQFQRLAAEQAVQAGNADAYEVAVSGAQALQSRIAGLQARQQAAESLDRALIEAHEQLQLQRLAAVQMLRARNTEGYETAVSGAEALQSRIATLQAQRFQP